MTLTTMTTDPDQIHARRWWTLAVLCFSLLVIGMDNTILNVALPTIQKDLGATGSQLQWIVDAYTIVYASILLTTGSLGDRFGRKGALSVGLVIFGVGSVLCATATTSGQLIAYRVVAGVGAATIMPATLSILSNVFGPEERGRAIGIWAGVSGLGIVAGPLIGGWLLGEFWWGSVFLINVPVVLIALVAGHYLVPTSRDANPPRLDLLGTVLGAVGLAALLYGVIEAPAEGWGATKVVGAFVAGAVILGIFLIWELRSDHPMLEVRFFRNPRFGAASVAVTLIFFAMFGSAYFLTQYLQYVLGYSPVLAGAALAPMALAMMVVAPNSAKVSRRFGTKLAVAVGMLVVAASLALLSFMEVDSSYAYVAVVVLFLGTGLGLGMSPATESIMGAVPREKAGVGSAMNDTTRQVGGALGVAVLGSLTAAHYHATMASSSALTALPGAAQDTARDSMGGAAAVAQQLGPAGHQLLADASQAFVSAMSITVLIGAAVAVAGAVVAFVFLPARPPLADPEPELLETLEEQGLLDDDDDDDQDVDARDRARAGVGAGAAV